MVDFQKKDWQFRDIISENELNRMEDGIEEGITKAEQAQQIANEAKNTADAAQSDLAEHVSATTGVHGATSTATPNTLVQRDPAGRFKAGAPSASDDAARKAEVDAVQTNLTNHIADYVRQPGYAVATGSANAYAVTLNPAPTAYTEGMAVAVKINVDNTGASTINVNGLGAKAIKKPNGNDVSAGNLKAGSIYTLRYNGTNFILQGEGGSGNAQPSDVLSGKTFTNDAGEQVGTMPNRGNVNQTLTNQGQEYTIPQGYHGGGGKVTANITNLTAANIKYGETVGGVAGTFSQTGSGATAAQILSGRVAFVNGAQVTGTMPNRAGDTAALSSVVSGTTLKLLASQGYRDGVDDYVTITDPDFIAANIRSGVNLFGLVGSMVEGKAFASGTTTATKGRVPGADSTNADRHYIQVTGLGFRAKYVFGVWGGTVVSGALFLTEFTSDSTGICRYNDASVPGYRGSAVVGSTFGYLRTADGFTIAVLGGQNQISDSLTWYAVGE